MPTCGGHAWSSGVQKKMPLQLSVREVIVPSCSLKVHKSLKKQPDVEAPLRGRKGHVSIP